VWLLPIPHARSGRLPACLTSRGTGLPTFTPARCAHPKSRTGQERSHLRHRCRGASKSCFLHRTSVAEPDVCAAREARFTCLKPLHAGRPGSSSRKAACPARRKPWHSTAIERSLPRRGTATAQPCLREAQSCSKRASRRPSSCCARPRARRLITSTNFIHRFALLTSRMESNGSVANCTKPTRTCRTFGSAACSMLCAPARRPAPCSASAWQP